jgi:hypothetical protein
MLNTCSLFMFMTSEACLGCWSHGCVGLLRAAPFNVCWMSQVVWDIGSGGFYLFRATYNLQGVLNVPSQLAHWIWGAFFHYEPPTTFNTCLMSQVNWSIESRGFRCYPPSLNSITNWRKGGLIRVEFCIFIDRFCVDYPISLILSPSHRGYFHPYVAIFSKVTA